ncbi:MAG: hypothetical protein PHY66_12665 [Aliarcobacter sp.]|nr:hypothetical protein [Aliarcobacter sp.]
MAEDSRQVDPDNINYTTNTYGSNSEETTEEREENDSEENIEPPIINEEFVKPKKSILPKILIGIVALLLLLLTIGAVLYFTGFFAPKEVTKTPENEVATPAEKVETNENSYKFDIKDINSKKLNEQLANLTSRSINNEKIDEVEKKDNEKKLLEEQKRKEDELLKTQEDELAKQKAQLEEKKLELEKEKAQLEGMKQQAAQLKSEIENNTSNNITDDVPAKATEKIKKVDSINLSNDTTSAKQTVKNENLTKDTNKNNQFLLFISVAKIKGVLYKKYLDKVVAVNPNIKLCRDDENRIELYYGPFEKSEDRSNLLNKLISNKFNEAYELEFTQEEYDKRCNY